MSAKESDGAAEMVPQIVEKVQLADEKLVAFVRERPVAALGAALAVGYVIGRIFSRLG
jgi:ElaB/YqjD/DUF883 family membrane-anchored ribosome-binding protein